MYRASCDTWDANVRISLCDPSIFIRFSASYLKFEESLWLTPESKILECFHHFEKLAHIPCHPNQTVLFKLNEVLTYQRTGENVIEFIKQRLRMTGPVIGCMLLRSDYLNPGVYHASGRKVNPSHFKNHKFAPQMVEDPMAPTPRRPQDPKEEEEEDPIQREDKTINAHAVAIVGYVRKDGFPCFIVQDSVGTNFGDNGFRYVTKFFVANIEKLKVKGEASG
ncbi:hypothetical protein LINPERHAP1_LOCUS24855 [Linum perenne]